MFRANSVDSYLKKIFELQKQKSTDFINCYRGESEDFGETSCIPGIYRNKNRVENEHRLFKESIIMNCDEFINDNLTINKLTRMQHYSLPTRLLDITTNALLGLYFACEKVEKEKDAVVTVFFIPKETLKYYDSDTVSVIANLAKRETFKFPTGFDKKISEIGVATEKKAYIDRFNQQKEILLLLHNIKDEKPYFKDEIVPEHLNLVVCVQPLLNNKRIRNQQGLMLLFGIDKTDKYKPAKPMFETEKIIIDGKSKPEIKKQLEMIGISQPFVYPEIEDVSKYLKEKYR